MKLFGYSFSFLMITLTVTAKTPEPEGRINSPFVACKDYIVVDKTKYQSNQKKWDDFAKECNAKVLPGDAAGFTSMDPLKEGVQYLEFSQRVAKKVLENLEKNRKYADCSFVCFSGGSFCHPSMTIDNKQVSCADRKKEVLEGMKVKARKIRLELAMAHEGHGFVSTNMHNVLSRDSKSFINKKLVPFESFTPFPVSKIELAPFEIKEAERRWAKEKKEIEASVKAMNTKLPAEITAQRLMENFDEHKSRYRSLIYEEAPIFSVIGDAKKYEGTDPVWEDTQVAKAFQKLSENAKVTKEKVAQSIANGKLEFSRQKALGNWFKGFSEAGQDADLLYFVGMKSQVEEVLKEDPSSCALATSMVNRLKSKDEQNVTFTLLASVGTGGTFKLTELATKGTLRVTAAITGKAVTGVVGIGLGASYLGHSMGEYHDKLRETATGSGLNEAVEGVTLRKDRDVEKARDAYENALILAPIDGAIGVGTAKLIFNKDARKVVAEATLKSQAAKSPSQVEGEHFKWNSKTENWEPLQLENRKVGSDFYKWNGREWEPTTGPEVVKSSATKAKVKPTQTSKKPNENEIYRWNGKDWEPVQTAVAKPSDELYKWNGRGWEPVNAQQPKSVIQSSAQKFIDTTYPTADAETRAGILEAFKKGTNVNPKHHESVVKHLSLSDRSSLGQLQSAGFEPRIVQGVEGFAWVNPKTGATIVDANPAVFGAKKTFSAEEQAAIREALLTGKTYKTKAFQELEAKTGNSISPEVKEWYKKKTAVDTKTPIIPKNSKTRILVGETEEYIPKPLAQPKPNPENPRRIVANQNPVFTPDEARSLFNNKAKGKAADVTKDADGVLRDLKSQVAEAAAKRSQVMNEEKALREAFLNNKNRIDTPPESLWIEPEAFKRIKSGQQLGYLKKSQFDQLPDGTIIENASGNKFIKGIDDPAVLGNDGWGRTLYGFLKSKTKTPHTLTAPDPEVAKQLKELSSKVAEVKITKSNLSILNASEERQRLAVSNELFINKTGGNKAGYEETTFFKVNEGQTILVEHTRDGKKYFVEGVVQKEPLAVVDVIDGKGHKYTFSPNVLSKFYTKPPTSASSSRRLPVMGEEVVIDLKSGPVAQNVSGTVIKRDGKVLTVQTPNGKVSEVYIQEADSVLVKANPKFPNGMTFDDFAKEAGYEQRSTSNLPEAGQKVLIEYSLGQGPHQVYGTVTNVRDRILTIKDAKGKETELYLQREGKLFVEKDKGAYIPENPTHPALIQRNLPAQVRADAHASPKQSVETWLHNDLEQLVKKKIISPAEGAYLQSPEGRKVLDAQASLMKDRKSVTAEDVFKSALINRRPSQLDDSVSNPRQMSDTTRSGQMGDNSSGTQQMGGSSSSSRQMGDSGGATRQQGDSGYSTRQLGDNGSKLRQQGENSSSSRQVGDKDSSTRQMGDDRSNSSQME